MADVRTGTDATIIAVPAPLSTTGGGTEATAHRVTIATDSTGVLSVDDNGGSLTVDGTVTANAGTNLNTSALALEAGGNLAAQTAALAILDDAVHIDDTATHATGTTKGILVMAAAVPTDTSVSANDIAALAMTTDRKLHVAVMDALPAGTAAIGKLAANSGVDIGDVDILTIAAGTNAIGNVGIVPRTTGGYTTYHLVSAATTNLVNVKSSAGQLFGWYIYNSNAAARKLAFHNSASAPTAGASIFFTLVIPPTSAANAFVPAGIAFSSGISISTVTGLADNDTAAVALNDLIINLFYS